MDIIVIIIIIIRYLPYFIIYIGILYLIVVNAGRLRVTTIPLMIAAKYYIVYYGIIITNRELGMPSFYFYSIGIKEYFIKNVIIHDAPEASEKQNWQSKETEIRLTQIRYGIRRYPIS